MNNDEKIEQNKDAEENTERLVLIVANEIPLNYEKEALKAQAVIARTNLVYAKKNGLTEPESVSKENLREILGTERYQKKYELIKECVEETKGKIVTYQGDEVYLPYHFVSAGFTRNAKKSDKKEQPYLKSVQSAADYQSDYFLKTIFLEKRQFYEKLKNVYPQKEIPEEIEKIAKAMKRDSASYVKYIHLPGIEISGEEFQKIFSLNSTCFSIKEVDGQVRIVTKGYGSGYGMSQFGGNEMAKAGNSFEDILKYYYDGIKIQSE